MFFKVAKLAQLGEFDDIIDVRSPAEFAEDHIPGAISCPVLDDGERARVGTLYCQQSPFAARRVGAALVARNIAAHIERHFLDRPKSWRPLIYCWRGGQRSAAMAIVLGQVGWAAHQLEYGYKAYRHQVLADLACLPGDLRFVVLCGPTGSGKSRLLAALARRGRQVLDLEGLAGHRGSLLGGRPDRPQPSQKGFESRLRQALSGFDPARPVFIEAESRNIGRISLPTALLDRMHAAACLTLEVPRDERLRLLLEDYAYLTRATPYLTEQLGHLKPFFSRQQIAQWLDQALRGDHAALVSSLLDLHYDPLYRRSTGRHFAQQCTAPVLGLDSLAPAALDVAAATLDAPGE